MSAGGQTRLSASEKERLEKALVRLVGSTRRSHRTKNLFQVASELKVAEKLLGSKEAVAREIGISTEMLREFASVTRVDESVQQMIKKGWLRSVDVAYRISMLPKGNQLEIAQAYVDKKLSGKEVRDVVSLFKRNPGWTIEEAIERVEGSRDIVQYIIRFRVPKNATKEVMGCKFARIVGKGNIMSLEIRNEVGNLTIDEDGHKMLQREAKKQGMTKRKFVTFVIEKG